MTARLPAVPAAVPIYSSAGDTRVLVIDLDTAMGGLEAVQRDTAAVTELVRTAGGRVIVDESPSGGRHVYVPLAEPVGFQDARDLALAIATRTPSMDPIPNQNLTDGLIRPPGSRHHSGGHQQLLGTLTDAHLKVLVYLRAQQAQGTAITIRSLGKSGVATTKELYDLFPGGPLKKSSKIAGIPKPVGCI